MDAFAVSNPANPAIHSLTTAQEVINDFPEGLDVLLAAVGTGGHISGLAKELKKQWPWLKVFAIEPENSPVLSGGEAGLHSIQGIGAGFIPKNLNLNIVDEVIMVSDEDAILTARDLAKDEGLLVGISSGANVYAALEIQKKYPSQNIVTILCDTSERYLSSGIYHNETTA